MTDLGYASTSELADRIRGKSISATELIEHQIGRFQAFNPRVNAIVATDFEGALLRAREADRALARGEVWGPLHGVPMTVVDMLAVKGLPATLGLPDLADNRSTGNVGIIDRLLSAGAIIFGKSNTSPFCVGWDTQNDLYGKTHNPWRLDCSPGGSTGGSAAAVAAGLTPLEIAVDVGNGIRIAAHYCGVCAHKPTFGSVHVNGQVIPGLGENPDMAVPGPLARCTSDLALALSLIAGPDTADAAAWTLSFPAPRAERPGQLRLAVDVRSQVSETDDEVAAAVLQVGRQLARKGAKVAENVKPAIDDMTLVRIFGGLLLAGVSARRADERFWELFTPLRARVSAAFDAPDGVVSHGDWLQLDNARNLIRAACAEFFRDWDVLLCPMAPCAAFPQPEGQDAFMIPVNGKPVPDSAHFAWASLATTAYLPATVVPVGYTRDGRPIGVQIIGPQYGDQTCLAVARMIEREIFAFKPPQGWG